MQGVCWFDVERVSIESIPEPRIESPDDAIVQVRVAGLCGSDLHVFHGRETGIDVPTVMGHEFVGRVVEVGPLVRRFKVGDEVCAPFSTNCGDCYYCQIGLTCRCESSKLFGWRQQGNGLHGGQAQFVRVPHADATLVATSGLDSDMALLLGDNLSTGFFCADLAEIKPNGVYVVIGCGAVGLCAIMAAKRRGAESVFAVDMVEHRLEMARSLGAIGIQDPAQAQEVVESVSHGRGADSVMELVGLPAAQKLAFELLRAGGTLATIGCHCEDRFAFSPVQAYDKNMTYRTGRCPARSMMERLKQPALQGEFNSLKSLVTHRFPLLDGANAYDVFANRRDGCIKAVLDVD